MGGAGNQRGEGFWGMKGRVKCPTEVEKAVAYID